MLNPKEKNQGDQMTKPKETIDVMLADYKTECFDNADEREDKKSEVMDEINTATRKYLVQKRGEHATRKGSPKSFHLKSHEEANELVKEIGRALYKHMHPHTTDAQLKKLADHQLMAAIDQATEKGYATRLVRTFSKQRRNITRSQAYNETSEAAGDAVADAKLNYIEGYLVTAEEHRKKIAGEVDKFAGEHGRAVKDGVGLPQLVGHLKSGYSQGKLTANYVKRAQREDFKAKKKGGK
jgi:hypothetical protein